MPATRVHGSLIPDSEPWWQAPCPTPPTCPPPKSQKSSPRASPYFPRWVGLLPASLLPSPRLHSVLVPLFLCISPRPQLLPVPPLFSPPLPPWLPSPSLPPSLPPFSLLPPPSLLHTPAWASSLSPAPFSPPPGAGVSCGGPSRYPRSPFRDGVNPSGSREGGRRAGVGADGAAAPASLGGK